MSEITSSPYKVYACLIGCLPSYRMNDNKFNGAHFVCVSVEWHLRNGLITCLSVLSLCIVSLPGNPLALGLLAFPLQPFIRSPLQVPSSSSHLPLVYLSLFYNPTMFITTLGFKSEFRYSCSNFCLVLFPFFLEFNLLLHYLVYIIFVETWRGSVSCYHSKFMRIFWLI